MKSDYAVLCLSHFAHIENTLHILYPQQGVLQVCKMRQKQNNFQQQFFVCQSPPLLKLSSLILNQNEINQKQGEAYQITAFPCIEFHIIISYPFESEVNRSVKVVGRPSTTGYTK